MRVAAQRFVSTVVLGVLAFGGSLALADPKPAADEVSEPITVEAAERILAAERPDAVLPTLGGQTGLNLAVALAERGTLDRYGVKLLGTPLRTIQLAEDLFLEGHTFKNSFDHKVSVCERIVTERRLNQLEPLVNE